MTGSDPGWVCTGCGHEWILPDDEPEENWVDRTLRWVREFFA